MTIQVTNGTDTATPVLVIGLTIEQDGRSVFHDVLGKNVPVITSRKSTYDSGTVTYLFSSYDDARTCLDLHGTGETISLTDDGNPNTDMQYAVGESVTMTIDDETRDHWTVQADYQRVDT